jgi:hypothetical protein
MTVKRAVNQWYRTLQWISKASKTWVILFVFLYDAITQIPRGVYQLDPYLAGLVAAALGFKTYKEYKIKEEEQIG